MDELDELILHVAVQDARRHVASGMALREAARRATPGNWAPLRNRVIAALGAGPEHPRGGSERQIEHEKAPKNDPGSR